MKILPSHKISGQLLDVIHEAKKELVLVSPYVNFTYSKQVSTALIAARNRNVKIDFFIRDEPTNHVSKEQVTGIGITPRLVPNLHAKFYFNESTGVITSLNLLSSSISNSIEIGCQLETAEELEELRHFVDQFLIPNETGRPVTQLQMPSTVKDEPVITLPKQTEEEKRFIREPFGQIMADFISVKIDRYSSVQEQEDHSLSIRAVGNTFTLFIERPSNRLIMTAIVSNFEANRFFNKGKAYFTSADYDHQVYRGGKGYYDTIRGIRKQKMTTAQLNELLSSEKQQLLGDVAQFILAARSYKATCSSN